jgi:serine/threonine-protein kinase
LLEEETETTPAAIRALVALQDHRAIRPLLATLQSCGKTVAKEVLRALVRLTDEAHAGDAQHAIAEAMPSFDAETRELAQETARALVSKYGEKMGSASGYSSTSSATAVQHQSILQAKPGSDRAASLIGDSSNDSAILVETPIEQAPTGQFINPMQLGPGAVLAERYRVISHVGSGAFGVVVLVEDIAVHEEIILKFLNPHLAANDHVIKRFIQELRYARKITHENVIRIYDFVTLGKSFAISMEYFPSHSLAEEIKSNAPLVNQRRLRIVCDLCCGMSVAHHAAIVHRDLKPQNVLVNDDGLVKIVDFGLAAAISHTDSRLTASGVIMGTPAYMAPEQVRGSDVDTRTDIYSLGVIMYEMFTGRPPYRGQEPMSILYQHVEGKAAAPSEINPDIPSELETIILTAMAVEPADRYQSVDTLREHLEALSGQEVG